MPHQAFHRAPSHLDTFTLQLAPYLACSGAAGIDSQRPQRYIRRRVDRRSGVAGLIDCHVHVGVPADNSFLQVDDPASPVDQFMTTLLRHGVKTVRDTGNSNPDEVFRAFEQGRDGRPRFFGAGTTLDGPADTPAPWRWPAIIDDEASARQETARLVEAGTDFIKVVVLPVGTLKGGKY